MSKVKNLDSRGRAIIAFGDSLTAGFGANAGEDYPARLAALTGATIENAGVSGDTTASAAERLERDVISRNPRIVILGLGGNDFLRGVPIATTEENLRSMIRKIQASGSMVMLLGYNFPSFTANYDKMYTRVAKDEGCLLVRDLLDGILSDSKLRSDEIHPNAQGYAIIAQRIEKPLKKLIAAADRKR
jgi:lysophospholipase L1-like esterase